MLLERLNTSGVEVALSDTGELMVKPGKPLTDEQRNWLKQHKAELIAEVEAASVEDLHEAREERAAILEYDQGFTRAQAEKEAARRTHFVTCGSLSALGGK